jgi:Tfp pilus assembly protein PilW
MTPFHAKSRFRSEEGLTMIELIIASAMMIVITGAAVSMLIGSLHRQKEVTQRADQVGQARVAVEKMVREIRQGVAGTVTTATATQLSFESYVDGQCGTTTVSTATKCKVTYTCASAKCSRTTGTSSTATTIAEGVTNATVFTYTKGASSCSNLTGETTTFIEVTLAFKTADGRGSTSLQDGAGLRSCT